MNSKTYQDKKAFYAKMLCIYGRNPVIEALQDPRLKLHALHLAESNKPAPVIKEMIALAEQRNIAIKYHQKQALSRITKNGKQDQGVALDIEAPLYGSLDSFISEHNHNTLRLLALDNVTNPQNVGMIIRSAAAGNIDGIIIPIKGCAEVGPLVIKASTGTVFKLPIIRPDDTTEMLIQLKAGGIEIASLDLNAQQSLSQWQQPDQICYILGNESEGVSDAVSRQAEHRIKIPMARGVESLNVAMTATLIAFS